GGRGGVGRGNGGEGGGREVPGQGGRGAGGGGGRGARAPRRCRGVWLRSIGDVPPARRPDRAARGLSRIGEANRLFECEPQDKRGLERATELPCPPRRPGWASAPRYHPYRSHHGLYRAGL